MSAGNVHHPKGYARYSGVDTARALTGAPEDGVAMSETLGAVKALIQNQHATIGVRWRDDGVTPTTTEGMLLAAGQTLEYEGDLSAFQFRHASASGGPVTVSYYGI